MQRLLYIPITLFFIFSGFLLSAQVQKVKYFVKYNDATCLFDFCIIITEGQATTMQQRVQMNCQYTVVVPTGSTVALAAKYMPLQSNQAYNGTIPMEWQLGSVVTAPASKPECDFYSVVPTLAPTSFYNNLNTNDTIALFGLAISPVVDCAKGIRVFDNATDPGPLDPGMNGSNFSNGFTIGGIQNKYDGNANPKYPDKPEVLDLQASCSQGLHLSVEARSAQTTCQQSLTYEWKGPEGFLSDEAVVDMPNAGPLQKGKYYITIKDSLGCSLTDSVQAFVKPDAGKDASVLCYQAGTATLKAKGSGTWEFASDNPGTAVFTDPNQSLTLVSDFSDPGLYKAIWYSDFCSDTVHIQVGSQCDCPIENTLEIPSVFLFCAEANSLAVSGNTIAENGNYQWIYKVDQGIYQEAGGNSTDEDYMISNMGSGSYEFRRVFTKTQPVLCRDTSNAVYFDILPAVSAGEDVDLFCFSSDTATIQASGSGVWSVLAESVSSLPMVQFGNPAQSFSDFTEAGQYLLAWSNEICVDTVRITANPYCGCDEANGGPDKEVCAGDTVTVQGTCSVGIWRASSSNPSGSTIISAAGGEAQITFHPSAMGSYYFHYIVFDTLLDSIKIDVRSLPVINAGEDFNYCQGSQPVLLVAGGGNQYHWSTGENGSNIMVSPAQTSTYSVTGTDVHGCVGSDTLLVTVMPKPQGMIPPPPTAASGTTVTLYSGNWTNAASFIWQGPNGFTSTNADPVIANVSQQHAGTYVLTVFSEDECASSGSVVLTVNQGTLPVEIHNFSGRYDKISQGNILEWEVASLINHDLFRMERSWDGIVFEEVEVVYSYGKIGKYEIFDRIERRTGTVFYRIISVDLDQKFEIFGPVSVQIESGLTQTFTVYPMPFSGQVFLTSDAPVEEPISLEVYNSFGQIVFCQKYSANYPNNLLQEFDHSKLKTGIYRLRLRYQEEYQVFSLIKVE